ncbi:MAG: hypothetical protein QOJ65_1475 [Fimbriimonadaceae bacterium]|nr:hypothetical protein [Fimbriimonadaceae bacterium]
MSVVGCSGSGKSTFGRALHERLGYRLVELDALYHGPNWEPATTEEFRAKVADATCAEPWIVDGNYLTVRDLTWGRADTIIWLDYSFPVCFSRVVRRTFRRWWRREVLWNENRERLWWHFFRRDSLFLWVMKTHRSKRQRYAGVFASPESQNKTLLRFETSAEAQEWLDTLQPHPEPPLADSVQIQA